MGRDSGIQWTDHTFNPWWGCMKVSPGCKNCYADTLSKRYGHRVFGPAATTDRRMMSEAHWRKPHAWDGASRRAVGAGGRRARVFCASMADVFEENPQLDAPRLDLFDLIDETFHLDWQVLTKRPENVLRMVPEHWREEWPDHVWIGTSVEDQERAEERIPELLRIPASVRFLSCEPLLGAVFLDTWLARESEEGEPDEFLPRGEIGWVIVGGESGPGARPCNIEGIREVLHACQHWDTPAFVKQLGAKPFQPPNHEGGTGYQLKLDDRKGGAIEEWPQDLRVREFPREVAA